MGKETKVGLFVIMLLLLLFGVVVVQKVRSVPSMAVAVQKPAVTPSPESAPESSEPASQPFADAEEPTIVEPEVFTPPADLEVPAAYTDTSGVPSPGLGLPDAAEVGLSGPGDDAASPAHRFMPSPTVDTSQYDARSRFEAPTSAPAPLAGEPEPARFNTQSSPDPYGGSETSSLSPRRNLAAIGGDRQPVQQGVSPKPDPLTPTEQGSSWSDLPDNVGGAPHASGRHSTDASDEREGGTWSTELPAATHNGPAVSALEDPLPKDDLADIPPLEMPPARKPSYAKPSRTSETAGNYTSSPSALAVPDVPPAIDDVAPPVGTQPLLSADTTYEVKENDSFWTISVKQYGMGRYFTALHLHNRQTVSVPEQLRPGMRISTPPPSTLERLYPEAISGLAKDSPGARSEGGASDSTPQAGAFRDALGGKRYRVAPSDTLFDIAKTTLGHGTQWREIYELNRELLDDPDRLKPGMVLRLPESARVNQVANSPLPPLR